MKEAQKLAQRKELRRALSPEVRAKFPPNKTLGAGCFGIRYRYKNDLGGNEFTRWYAKESGRDQAFKKMNQMHRLPTGRTYTVYAMVEKVNR